MSLRCTTADENYHCSNCIRDAAGVTQTTAGHGSAWHLKEGATHSQPEAPNKKRSLGKLELLLTPAWAECVARTRRGVCQRGGDFSSLRYSVPA